MTPSGPRNDDGEVALVAGWKAHGRGYGLRHESICSCRRDLFAVRGGATRTQ